MLPNRNNIQSVLNECIILYFIGVQCFGRGPLTWVRYATIAVGWIFNPIDACIKRMYIIRSVQAGGCIPTISTCKPMTILLYSVVT